MFLFLKKVIGLKTIKNISFVSCGTFGTAIIGLIFGIVAARYLGPEDFGRFGYYISIFATIGVLFALGMDIYLVIQIAKDPEKANKSITSNIINRSIAIVCFSILFWILNFYLNFIPVELATVILFFTAIINSFETLTLSVYRAFEEMKYMSIFKIARPFFMLLFFVVLAAVLKMRIEGAALASFLSVSIVFIASYFTMVRRFNFKFETVDKFDLIELINKSLPFILTSIVAMLYLQVDTIMINRIIGDAETGYFVIATQIMTAMLLLPGVFNTILLPKMSRRNFDSSRNKIWLVSLFFMGIIVSLALFGSAGILIRLFFGNEYSTSIGILRILLWTLPLVFINASLSTFLSAKDQQKKVLFINSVALLLNIPLDFIFIPYWGAKGAAFTTLICAVITVILYLLFYKSYVNKYEKVKMKPKVS